MGPREDIKAPQFQPPAPGPGRSPTPDELRGELATLRQNLCEDLTYIAGVILNTGILTRVPPRIQELTGLHIDELEAKETRACLEPAGEAAAQKAPTVEGLLDEVRTIEWLIRMHLVAMREVTEEAPRLRPVEAEGALRAFLELHDVIVGGMRRGLSDLRANPTIETARGFAEFWQQVVIPHAQAEDRVLWPLARSLGAEGLTRSVDLLEAEHHEIDGLVASYAAVVDRLERGEAQGTEALRAAQAVRGRVELHFGKEEESVLRPMRPLLTDEQLWPVVEEQDRTVGKWLRAHGWQAGTTTAG